MPENTAFDPRRSTLGETLIHLGLINAEQLTAALKQCGGDQKNVSEALVALGYTTEDKILKAVSLRLGIPCFTSLEGMVDMAAVRRVPEFVARQRLAVPLFLSDDSITVGMVNPIDMEATEEIQTYSGLRVVPVMTTLSALFTAVQEAYGAANSAPQPRPDSAPADPGGKEAAGGFQAEERSVVDTVTAILQEAMARKASDIHLEPEEKSMRVRYRVDGMLQEGRSFNKEMESPLVARIKILSKIDITETRLPQDGHLRFEYGGQKVDVRVSSLPLIYGEKLVLRILDSNKALKQLDQIGLSEANLKSFSNAIRRPNGIILVTGPTGSGKTTTLYAALSALNEKHSNVVTLEDPVEYRLPGINQMEAHAKIGLTFAAGLRAVLRQDPNVVLVGEIRDLETAEIAMQASLTGHLVFATLHTNDAVSAVHRLLNMRIEPFLISAALSGVMAQRLLRRLCDRCKVPTPISAHETEALGALLRTSGPFYSAPGCNECFNTGYTGRFAVHEWFNLDRAARDLVLKRASPDDLLAAAQKAGMRTLQQDGLEKAAKGLTSLAEVIRATRDVES